MIIPLLSGVLFAAPAFAQVPLEASQVPAAELVLKMRGARQGTVELSAEPAAPPAELSALQKHLSFFDRDGNGTVTRFETVLSLEELGMSPVKATAAALVIHVALGPKTTGRWGSLDVSVANIKLGKHGSDTGAFDEEGRFVPEAFERIFSEFDANRSGSLSDSEILAMVEANSKLRPGAASASKIEFQLLLALAADRTEGADKKPALSKERMRDFYDGSLFFKIAKRGQASQIGVSR